jgi:hypothetical protein
MNDSLLSDNQVQELNQEFGFDAHNVEPEGHRCPLCPDHKDFDFVWYDLLDAMVCVSCTYDLYYDLMEDDRPSVNVGCDYANTNIGLLEKLTGQTFHQLRFRQLFGLIVKYYGAVPDHINGTLAAEYLHMPELDLRIINKLLCDEVKDFNWERERIADTENQRVFDNLVFNDLSKTIKEKLF